MGNIITVFNNRNHSMQFASYLKRAGVPCKTVNTPRELSVACGISVVFTADYLSYAKIVLNKFEFSSFNRFFAIESDGIFKKYKPI